MMTTICPEASSEDVKHGGREREGDGEERGAGRRGREVGGGRGGEGGRGRERSIRRKRERRARVSYLSVCFRPALSGSTASRSTPWPTSYSCRLRPASRARSRPFAKAPGGPHTRKYDQRARERMMVRMGSPAWNFLSRRDYFLLETVLLLLFVFSSLGRDGGWGVNKDV